MTSSVLQNAQFMKKVLQFLENYLDNFTIL